MTGDLTARPAVSIVVPVWNAADVTRTCLRLLPRTLGPQDEVIVVDNGSSDHTSEVLAEHAGHITAVVHEENLGFAAGCNAGAAVATRPVVVFLNNDTLPAPGWLESLLHPFAASDVGAVGPMSNFVSGPQLLHDDEYQPTKIDDVAAHAKAVHERHGTAITAVDRLVGFCLAVRRDVFEALGGFDTSFGIGGCEDDDLSTRIRRAGLRLLVARGSFVHHIGHQTFDANAVDWAAVEIGNHDVLRRNEERRPELSVLVHCAASTEALVATLIDVVDASIPPTTELLLLTDDEPALASIAESIDGDVLVIVLEPGSDPWRQGLLRANGRRRALIRAGENIDASRLAQLLSASATSTPVLVGTRERAPATPGGPVPFCPRTVRSHSEHAPLVSVLVRTFNRAEMLARCLDHLSRQRHDDFEVVIVNDAGCDVTDVIASFPSLRTQVVVNGIPAGRAGALDAGLRAARGELVCIVDDDDVIYPEHLSSLVAASSGSRKAVYSQALEALEEGGAVLTRRLVHARDFSRQALLASNFLPILTVLFPRREALEVGGFTEDLAVLEDWEFWLRLSATLPFAHLPQVTCEYRLRADRSNATVGQRGVWVEALRSVYTAHPSDDPDVQTTRRGHVEGWSRATPAYERSLLVVGDVGAAEKAVEQALSSRAATQVVVVLVREADGERFARTHAGADADVVLVAPERFDVEHARGIAIQRALGRRTSWWPGQRSDGAAPAGAGLSGASTSR